MPSPRALVLTAEEGLLDDLLRLVAAAGGEADVAQDVGQVRARWRTASLVLLGVDRLAAAQRARLPRRDGVLLVGHAPLDPPDWSLALDLGVQQVLCLPGSEALLVDLLAQSAERAEWPGRVVGVIGGQGGAGASVLAASLAVTAARLGERTLLLDADPIGGGLDVLFGAETTAGLRWPDLAEASGRLSAAALHQALPSVAGVSILAHERGRACQPGAEPMLAVARTARAAGDLVVADLPRQLGPGPAAVAAAADLVLLVVPAEVRACAAAGRVAEVLATMSDVVRVVVRYRSSGGMPPDAVAAAVGLPLAAALRSEPRLARDLEGGQPPALRRRGAAAVLCRSLLLEGRRRQGHGRSA